MPPPAPQVACSPVRAPPKPTPVAPPWTPKGQERVPAGSTQPTHKATTCWLQRSRRRLLDQPSLALVLMGSHPAPPRVAPIPAALTLASPASTPMPFRPLPGGAQLPPAALRRLLLAPQPLHPASWAGGHPPRQPPQCPTLPWMVAILALWPPPAPPGQSSWVLAPWPGRPLQLNGETDRERQSRPAPHRPSSWPAPHRHQLQPAPHRHQLWPPPHRHQSQAAPHRHQSWPASRRQQSLPAPLRHPSWPSPHRHQLWPAPRRHQSQPAPHRHQPRPASRRQ
mmetsp:Transcript_84676/g.188092  ORF Transcript_84676/g.188092 Transcript_84676/m.188092 type:complete len:281 (+) Transcript_84676:596-1438(+)